MAIMSFAHLKNKKPPEIRKGTGTSPSAINKPVGKTGTGKVVIKPPEVKVLAAKPKVSRIPKVMLTANMTKVNYCAGCPRFSPAEGWEKKNGNPYGRCLRVIDMEKEFPEMWRIIPSRATVARCYYHIKDKKEQI